MIDHGPAARRLAALLPAIPDSALTGPTPCADLDVATLLDHVHGLAIAFRQAAAKDLDGPSQPPEFGASSLDPEWRTRIPELLDDLVAAWQAPDAWTGMTEAGGVQLPGDVAGSVALNELIVHGWDLARATGRPYTAGEDEVEACLEFVRPAVEETGGKGVDGLFGPAVPVPGDAAPLDRLLGLTGRDPSWTP
ncbi:TIGR03086 family metal-binding protein [Spirillospora albida]|uniref:TIGR03086 family metal-binding protein n=1 Tax=Spirillospora albida TaxID=58123 RepID=UPI0004C114A6|nr:TIGR03086 family metal-binding protein [Spirillospora albida]